MKAPRCPSFRDLPRRSIGRGIVFVCFAVTVQLAHAERIPPKPAGYFNDYANVVPHETALQLNETLAQFERETSNQIVVAVYQSMQSESDIADYTRRVAQTWGVGQEGKKNGAVLFVFVADHKMFIQTGYGLEGALPDATCFDITRNMIAPRFKQGDYAGGLTVGVQAMMQAARGEFKGSGRTVREGSDSGGSFPVGLIIFLVFVAIIVFANRKQRRRRGYGYSGWGGPFIGGFGGGGWGGGSSGGGGFSGFSGGGGSFGGGGAGSSW